MNSRYERQIFNIAEGQGGYFTISQAKKAGIPPIEVYRDVKRGKLTRTHREVYRLALFPNNRFEQIHAAVLSAGEKAIVGFETALYIYDLSDIIPNHIHIILPRNSSRRRKHFKMHTTSIENKDITKYEGLPITTVSRTIIDVLRKHGDIDQIKLAINQAINRGMTDEVQLIETAKRISKSVTKKISNLINEVTREGKS